MYYTNEESNDAIGGSTQPAQHSIENNSRNIKAVFFAILFFERPFKWAAIIFYFMGHFEERRLNKFQRFGRSNLSGEKNTNNTNNVVIEFAFPKC